MLLIPSCWNTASHGWWCPTPRRVGHPLRVCVCGLCELIGRARAAKKHVMIAGIVPTIGFHSGFAREPRFLPSGRWATSTRWDQVLALAPILFLDSHS